MLNYSIYIEAKIYDVRDRSADRYRGSPKEWRGRRVMPHSFWAKLAGMFQFV